MTYKEINSYKEIKNLDLDCLMLCVTNTPIAIEIANNTRYGLAGSIWTSDLEKGKRVAENIHSGMVWVNTWLHRDLRVPFGGVKDSGVGREGGKWSLGFFSEPLNVCVRHD